MLLFGLHLRIGLRRLLRGCLSLLRQRGDALLDGRFQPATNAVTPGTEHQHLAEHRDQLRELLACRQGLRHELADRAQELRHRLLVRLFIGGDRAVGLDVEAEVADPVVAEHRQNLRQLLAVRPHQVGAGSQCDGLVAEMLRDDLAFDPDDVAAEPRDLRLPILQAQAGELPLDALRRRGLGGNTLPADDVRQPSDLVDLVLHRLTRGVELLQHPGDLLDGQPFDVALHAAGGGERRPAVDRDQLVLDARLQQALHAFRLGIVDTRDFERLDQQRNPLAEFVDLVGLILVLDEVRDRHQRVVRHGAENRFRAREEAGQPQRILALVQHIVLAVARDPDDRLRALVPNLVDRGLLVGLELRPVIAGGQRDVRRREIQRDLRTDVLAEALDQLRAGHVDPARNPPHLTPDARRVVQEIAPVDVIGNDLLVLDLIVRLAFGIGLAVVIHHDGGRIDRLAAWPHVARLGLRRSGRNGRRHRLAAHTEHNLCTADQPAHQRALDPTIARIEQAVAAFWQAVEAETPPLDVADFDTVAELSLLGAEVRAAPLDLTTDNELPILCAEYLKTDASVKESEAKRSAIKAQITRRLGDAPETIRANASGFNIS